MQARGRRNEPGTTDELLTMDMETNNGNGTDPTFTVLLTEIVILDDNTRYFIFTGCASALNETPIVFPLTSGINPKPGQIGDKV